jgi:hypothetical protein
MERGVWGVCGWIVSRSQIVSQIVRKCKERKFSELSEGRMHDDLSIVFFIVFSISVIFKTG